MDRWIFKQIKLCLLLSLVVLFSVSPNLLLAQNPASLAKTHIPRLEKVLKENIISFWDARSLDHENGGYIIDFGPNGERKEQVTKMIVTQSRMVWLYSRLARDGYSRREHLKAADLGYQFLKEKMWDSKNGGFYWEVDVSGGKKLKPRKHLYGQAFALYAVSEYYLACKRRDVLDFAIQFFNLLEEKCHDGNYGGYIESFDEDWKPLPDNEPSYMGVESGLKLMNTHLHLLEALTAFYRASRSPLARERLLELTRIQSNTVVRKDLGACTDKYERDWTPRLDGDYARVSYGHDLENIWLLIDACNAAKVSNYPLLDLYKTLFDYSLKYGYDQVNGGFYDSGPFNKPADRRAKVWWVQAEALVSPLYMHRLTKDPKYLGVFEKTYDFIEKNMVDWQHGEWHANITPEGHKQGDKANAWKAGYHNGRAMIECLKILKQNDS